MKLTVAGLKRVIAEEVRSAKTKRRRLRESAGSGSRTAHAIANAMAEAGIDTTDHASDAMDVASQMGNPDVLWGKDNVAWADWVVQYVDDHAEGEGRGLVTRVAEEMFGGRNSFSNPAVLSFAQEYWSNIADGSENPLDDISDDIFSSLAGEGGEDTSPPMTAEEVADAVGDFSY